MVVGFACTQVVTQFGRPNWPHIIADVADNHPGQTVGVFVCGPPPFTKSIKHACEDFNASATTRIKVRKLHDSEFHSPVCHCSCDDSPLQELLGCLQCMPCVLLADAGH